MRIVHLIDHFQAWMGYQETYLAREQARLGCDVAVVTSNRYTRIAGALNSGRRTTTGLSEEHGIQVYRLPVYLETPTNAAYVWLRDLTRTLRTLAPDVVHCHGMLSFTAVQAAYLKKRLHYGLIYDNHMADFNVYHMNESTIKGMAKRTFYQTLAHTLGSIIVNRADAIVAIGEPERAFVHWLFRDRCPHVPIIRLGADTHQFTFRSEGRARIRQQMGWCDEDVVLGHAGTIRASKRIDLLLQAGRQLADQGIPVRMLVVGKIEPVYLHHLQNEVSHLQLDEKVIFEKFVSLELLPEYLSAMDIAVWPGDISNTAIEAMAVGLPVVACRTAYTEAIVEQYGAGVLFEAANLPDLALALAPLASHQAERDAYARRARAAVERDLNWRSIAAQFIQLYSTILERRSDTCPKIAR
jgi:glycosyltransferase involved in cell wall biosynthesis